MRFSSAGRVVAVPAPRARYKRGWPPKTRQTLSTIAGVVVSSSAMLHRGVPSSRKLIFSCAARAMISWCWPSTATVTVSKIAVGLRREAELLSAPAASTAVRRCTVRAMCVEAFGTMINGVHRGDHRQQHLRGADIGGGFFSRRMCCSRVCSARR